MTADQISDYDAYVGLIDQAATLETDAAELLASSQIKSQQARDLRAEAKVIATRLGLVC